MSEKPSSVGRFFGASRRPLLLVNKNRLLVAGSPILSNREPATSLGGYNLQSSESDVPYTKAVQC